MELSNVTTETAPRFTVTVGASVAFDGAEGCDDGTVLAIEDSGAGDVATVRWWPSARVGTVGVDELRAL